MTRRQRTKLLAEQTRLLPQLDALLRRAAGWIDPSGGAPSAMPEAPAPMRRARRAAMRGAAADGDDATRMRASNEAAAAPTTARATVPTSRASRVAEASAPMAASTPTAAPAPVLRLRLPVRRAAPVQGRVAKVASPIAPVAANAPATMPLPPRASNSVPQRSAVASASVARAAATAIPVASSITRRATPQKQSDNAGGAWSALERLAAWPSRGTPATADAAQTHFRHAENADPFANAALEDRIEAILDRALAETGLDPA